MDVPVCRIPECGRKVAARRLCQTHYKRDLKGLPLDAPIKAAAVPALDLPDGRRVCKRCQEALPLDRFDVDRRAKTGRRADCKACRSGYMKTYYSEHSEDRRAYMRARLLENPEHVRALDAERYLRDRDKRSTLATEHAQVRRARLLGREYEKGITVRRLRDRDGDACCHCGVEMIFRRFKAGEGTGEQATIEHLVPVSKGGTHTWENVALACRDCNFRRGAKSLDEWKPDSVARGEVVSPLR